MSAPPFFIVTLTHPTWEEALACARHLPEEALPELRLDLLPELAPGPLVDALHRRCLVTCRRASEGGAWPDGDEAGRMERLREAVDARPAWVDLEWEVPIPAWLQEHRGHVRILRSVHVAPGVFDLGTRLGSLPDGDAYKWVGHAGRLSDNAQLRDHLAWARDHRIFLSAFLMGPKGVPSRCLQGPWGGSFTYAAPDDGPPAAPGQIALASLRGWRCHRLSREVALGGVLGHPVMHSKGPDFHNSRFQRSFKDLLYLPLDAEDAEEALEALEALGILGASLTMPLKQTLPERLGLRGPLNTLWRRDAQAPWETANTDAEALISALQDLPRGPVLVLGDGGVAATSLEVLGRLRRPAIQASRRRPLAPAEVTSAGPVGVIQATGLGMREGDPAPFPGLLEAARPSLRWAVEWIYRTDTAFAAWARTQGLTLVEGARLFELQAEAQSRRFITGCG